MMEIKQDNNPKSIRMSIKDKIVNLERNDYHYYNLSNFNSLYILCFYLLILIDLLFKQIHIHWNNLDEV